MKRRFFKNVAFLFVATVSTFSLFSFVSTGESSGGAKDCYEAQIRTCAWLGSERIECHHMGVKAGAMACQDYDCLGNETAKHHCNPDGTKMD